MTKMAPSNNDKINGYRLATLPLFSGTQSPFINDNLKVSPTVPIDGVITRSLTKKYTFTVEKDVVESAKTTAIEKYRWVIAYGDPFLYPSSFTEEGSILAYGETSNFSFTFDEGGRDYYIRVDLFDGSSSSFTESESKDEDPTRISRILKLKTTSDGETEKMGYIVLFLMVFFVVLILLAIVVFGKKGF